MPEPRMLRIGRPRSGQVELEQRMITKFKVRSSQRSGSADGNKGKQTALPGYKHA